MNHGTLRKFSLCIAVVLVVAGCQSNSQERAFIPITGVDEAAQAERARDQVLEYLRSSARLTGVPESADWQQDEAEAPDGEYRLRSGDWLLIIRSATAEGENQLVMLMNQVDRASWTGYITPDGRVVDTAYYR